MNRAARQCRAETITRMSKQLITPMGFGGPPLQYIGQKNACKCGKKIKLDEIPSRDEIISESLNNLKLHGGLDQQVISQLRELLQPAYNIS